MGPECRDLHVEVVSLLFRHKTHAQNVLTGCTNIHGGSFTVCALSPSALRSARVVAILWKRCVVFVHGGLLAQNNRAGLHFAVDSEMPSKTAECESDLVL